MTSEEMYSHFDSILDLDALGLLRFIRTADTTSPGFTWVIGVEGHEHLGEGSSFWHLSRPAILTRHSEAGSV
jgi:hypothetical protein